MTGRPWVHILHTTTTTTTAAAAAAATAVGHAVRLHPRGTRGGVLDTRGRVCQDHPEPEAQPAAVKVLLSGRGLMIWGKRGRLFSFKRQSGFQHPYVPRQYQVHRYRHSSYSINKNCFQNVHGGRMKFHHKPSTLQTHHELFLAHTGVMRCIAQPLRGGHYSKEGL